MIHWTKWISLILSGQFQPNAEYTFSSTHGTCYRIEYILGHKSCFSKFKKIEIVSRFFFNKNAMRLDVNYKKKKL